MLKNYVKATPIKYYQATIKQAIALKNTLNPLL